MRNIMLTLVALAFMLGAVNTGNTADWDLAAAYADSLFHTKNIKLFAEDVKKASNGSLNIKVHPGGALIKKNKDNRNAVRSNQIQAAEFLGAWLSNEEQIWAVDTLPFTATSYEAAMKLWKSSKPAIEKALDKQGLKLLFAVPWPPQGLYSVKEIKSIDNLKGMKFRTYSPFTSRFAMLAGAAGTEIQPPLATAFQTGRVEAMITSSSFGVANKAWDYLEYFYDVQAWLPKNFIVVSKRALAKLDDATQKVVLEAAANAETRGWQMSADSNSAAKKALADNNMKVVAPSPGLVDGFKTIGKTMGDEWAEKAGSAGKAILDSYTSM